MQTNFNDKEIHHLQERLKHDLKNFKVESRNLEFAFESAAKHMPVYLKIVKGHIEQLAKVLELETHHRRNLENAGLAEPIIQLMQLFRELDDEDIHLLDSLAQEAKNWPNKQDLEELSEEKMARIATEA